MQVQLYPLEFTIMRYGELGLEMFILAHGSAAVLAESGSLIAELHPVQPCVYCMHPDATRSTLAQRIFGREGCLQQFDWGFRLVWPVAGIVLW